MEVIWIGVPLVLGLVMFAWGAQALFRRITKPPGDALEIAVVGKQWMWHLQHPEGRSEINELHVPVGRPVKLTMISQDVIHSFYVPAFRVKQDVLPGRYTTMWFEPTKVGRYHLFCAEYCGTNHSTMRGSVTVMEPSTSSAGCRRAASGRRWPRRASGCSCSITVRAATAAARRCTRLGWRGFSAGRCRSRTGATSISSPPTRPTFAIRSCRPKAQVVAGYEPVMPSYPGPDQRAGPLEDHRLHQVDRSGGPDRA